MTSAAATSFGVLLRRLRRAAGLTQEALAERAGLSARGIQDLERGVREAPRAETVRMLADALQLDGEPRATLFVAAHPDLAIPASPAAFPLRPKPLPYPPTPLVGREREVAAACALLGGHQVAPGTRLLTLTGPGGVGKSRLAVAIAAELTTVFTDGVAWVEFAALRDPDLVSAALADALGVRESGEQSFAELLKRAINDRRLLLVLDNCEHVLPAIPLIGNLLGACPNLVMLATSRIRLRLRGERELPVEPLVVPVDYSVNTPLAGVAGVAAVRLFVERAQDVVPGFTLTKENAKPIVTICQRLDGLPLALELAAARSKLLSPAALLERLDPRLPLLSGGARDAPARQQTMRDAIAWSYGLLSVEEQAAFRRLAIFAGGFTVEAAEVVVHGEAATSVPTRVRASPDTLATLGSLIDQSLLRSSEPRFPSAHSAELRFAMLETVREFAFAQLAESGGAAAIQQAHAVFFLGFAESAESELTGPLQAEWLDLLDLEHDNLRAALTWALSEQSSGSVGVRLAGALWRYWWMRGHYREGRGWLEATLAHGSGTAAVRAKALYGAGSLATEQGDYEQATSLLETALAAAHVAGDGAVAALALTDLGSIARQQGAYQRATEFHDRALALRKDAGDQRGIAVSFGNLGLALLYQGQYDRAEELLTNAAMAFRDLGDSHSFITTTSNLALAAVMRGDFARARLLVEESLTGYRALRDHQGMADDLVTLGLAAQGGDDLLTAEEHFSEALGHARRIGYKLGEAAALHRLGLVALESGNTKQALVLLSESLRIVGATGDFEEMAGVFEALARVVALSSAEHAARCLGMAAAIRNRCGTRRPPAENTAYERMVMEIRGKLGDLGFASASAAGGAFSLDHAVAEALTYPDGLPQFASDSGMRPAQ